MGNNDPIIIVEELSKKYHLGVIGATTLLDSVERWWHRFRGRDYGVLPEHVKEQNAEHGRFSQGDIWALKDVSFSVKQGEVVGIIGKNGAGKSTLLKLLTRITEPTSGRAILHGRVASLLEVGTGFHPELTGRENIFLNGAILGLKKREIIEKFDDIVAFAEIEQFIDTPVKRYSSGMYVRLAFAVAAHLEPEILFVDEVLSVGDAAFQKKCLGKMSEVAGEGRTVLFVSHNMTAVSSLCSRGLLLEGGCLKVDSNVGEAVKQYLRGNKPIAQKRSWELSHAPGNEFVRILETSVRPLEGDVISIDSGIEIDFVFQNNKEGKNLDFTFYLRNELGVLLFETGMNISEDSDSEKGVYRIKGQIPKQLLNSGLYNGDILIGENQRYVVFRLNDAISFEIINTATGRGSNLGVAPGVIRPILNWQCKSEQLTT